MLKTFDERVDDAPRQPVGFSGTMGSFVGLAAVNLLLTILTLGIYRFWAKTRVRRYLWSSTSFAGDPLEYRGTGLELLVGALLAFVLVLLPLVVVSLVLQSLFASGVYLAAGLAYLALIAGLFYIMGVGLYRSQRYLLSRTSWRGIRGGMTTGGWRYGLTYLGWGLAQMFSLGLASPTVSTRLWNGVMNDAMFGSFAFRAEARSTGLYPRFLLSLLASYALLGVAVAAFWGVFAAFGDSLRNPGAGGFGAILTAYLVLIGAFFAIGLIMASYQAALLRRLYGSTTVGDLRLGFTAETMDVVRFALGNTLIIVLTLGLGIVVMPYRVWSFYARHLTVDGALDAEALAQTALQGPVQGDGIADAFDMSAV